LVTPFIVKMNSAMPYRVTRLLPSHIATMHTAIQPSEALCAALTLQPSELPASLDSPPPFGSVEGFGPRSKVPASRPNSGMSVRMRLGSWFVSTLGAVP